MKTNLKLIAISGLLGVSATIASVGASASSPVRIDSDVKELIQVVDEQGKASLKAVEPTKVTPGDRILYTTTISNFGQEASDNIVITNPVPAHTRYLDGTAKGEHFAISYSVDGGKVWGQPQALKVRQADGQLREAKASDFTHIRWQYRGSLLPSEVKKISFQTQLL